MIEQNSFGRPCLVRVMAVLLSFAVLAGCQTPIAQPQADQAIPPAHVTLASGDVIRLTFPGAPELNQTQKIRADGRLSLPQIGEVAAAGKSVPQLRAELVALYQAQLKNSEVVVTLETAVTQVYITGAVNKPGKLVFDRPTTVLQAISEAGGFNQFANARRVQLIRIQGGVQKTQVLDLRSPLSGQGTRPFYVRDGDTFNVPQSAF